VSENAGMSSECRRNNAGKKRKENVKVRRKKNKKKVVKWGLTIIEKKETMKRG